jgi:hypothetical protein
MSVRGAGRGGKAGGAGRAAGAGRSGGPSKAKGTFGGKVDKPTSLAGASGLVASANAQSAAATSPVLAQVLELARLMKAGEIKNRDEATKRLVRDILRQKVRTQSKRLADEIIASLKDDPRMSKSLERLWTKAEQEE